MCYGFHNTGGVSSQSRRLRERTITYYFEMDRCLFVPRQSSFRSTMILGVREGNLYRLRGHPMRVVTNRSRGTNEEEQVAPLVVRQVAPPTTQV
jgi:hypothetical protein